MNTSDNINNLQNENIYCECPWPKNTTPAYNTVQRLLSAQQHRNTASLLLTECVTNQDVYTLPAVLVDASAILIWTRNTTITTYLPEESHWHSSPHSSAAGAKLKEGVQWTASRDGFDSKFEPPTHSASCSSTLWDFFKIVLKVTKLISQIFICIFPNDGVESVLNSLLNHGNTFEKHSNFSEDKASRCFRIATCLWTSHFFNMLIWNLTKRTQQQGEFCSKENVYQKLQAKFIRQQDLVLLKLASFEFKTNLRCRQAR